MKWNWWKITGLAIALATIGVSAFAMYFVTNIVALGGSRYLWEYIPPAVMLTIGILNAAHWIRR